MPPYYVRSSKSAWAKRYRQDYNDACSDQYMTTTKRAKQDNEWVIDDLMAYKRQKLPPTPPQDVPKRPVHFSQVTGRSPSQKAPESREDQSTAARSEATYQGPTDADVDAMITEANTAHMACKFDNPAQGTVCHLHDHSAVGTTGESSGGDTAQATAQPSTCNEQDDISPDSSTASTAGTYHADSSREGDHDQAGQSSPSDNKTDQDAKYTASQLDAASELASKQLPLRAKLWFPAPELYPDVFKPSGCQDFKDLLTQIDVFKASRSPDTQSRSIKVILVEIHDRNGRLTRLRILNNGFHGRDAFEEFLEEISALESSANDGERRSTVDLIVEWEEPGEVQ